MVLEQRLERLEHLHLAGDARGGLGLPLHHRHPQGPLMPRHQALQVLQEQLVGRTQAAAITGDVNIVVNCGRCRFDCLLSSQNLSSQNDVPLTM